MDNKYKTKVLTMSDRVVIGYVYDKDDKFYIIDDNGKTEEANPYAICRNTGIENHGEYLYEDDLLELEHALRGKKIMGFIVFDSWSQGWKVRDSINMSGTTDIKKYNKIKVIGNIATSTNDYDKMQKYSDEEDVKYSPDVTLECRSKQSINRQTKMFLPKN